MLLRSLMKLLAGVRSLLTDYWLETSVSCHMGHSIEQITTWQLASLRVKE